MPLSTVEVAVGWTMRHMTEGLGGINIALGLLALKRGTSADVSRSIQLSFANFEVLRFLRTALDVAVLIEMLPNASIEDLNHMRLCEEMHLTMIASMSSTK